MSNLIKQIFVTQPDLPDLKTFIPYLEQIWKNKQLTNGGPFHHEFESELCRFLGVNYISLFANGTLALITALKALNITGDVITTPYSFPATTNSLLWNNNRPIFVDIEPQFGNIDTTKIENAISSKTSAILAVHVYGNPCNVNEIDEIAKKHSLKVIYDAAHCFGVKLNGQSLANYGDLSVLSFHATKVFNTMEGGAIVSHDLKTKQRIDSLKNFGFLNENEIHEPGINSKMNEMQAALGLLQLKNHHANIQKRKQIFNNYKIALEQIPGIKIITPPESVVSNYAYCAVIVNEKKFKLDRNELHQKLKANNIFTRKYFHPLITSFDYCNNYYIAKQSEMPCAEQMAAQVLCLPIYPSLESQDQYKIINSVCSLA